MQLEGNNLLELITQNNLLAPELRLDDDTLVSKSLMKIYASDNSRIDEPLGKRVFGDHIRMQDDLFHQLKKIFESAKNCPGRLLFMAELCRVALRSNLEDLTVVARRLIDAGKW